jgi:glycosyltransferase involved in cell wall biosynthesis
LTGAAGSTGQPRALVLSREYPNDIAEFVGMWVERLVRSSATLCQPRVIAPVPYAPPLPVSDYYRQFRRIDSRETRNGVEVVRPRFLIGPGQALRGAEAASYYASARRVADRLHEEVGFDLIHAHFTYPDGVAAVQLGKRYGVPTVITEHAPWGPWLERQPLIRRQMLFAGDKVSAHIAVSRAVRKQIAHHTGRPDKVRVVPVGVDGREFPLANGHHKRDPDQILYVGHINTVKGVDTLLAAMKILLRHRPSAKLVLIGGTFYRAKQRLADGMVALARDLGLNGQVQFLGARKPADIARYMHESSVLVLPSRSESFGCVLVEALACGTPVVATRCGGPEDIVHDGVGRLVAPEDETVLAAAILDVLSRREEFDPARLRAYALENFSWERVAEQTVDVYHDLLERPKTH